MKNPRKAYVKSFGCQMNVYDSARMADALAAAGFAEAAEEADADVVVLNTCHIREKAAEKVYSELGRLKQLKEERARRGDTLMLAVAGCVAQAEGAFLLERAPAVDVVVGPQSYHRLPALLRETEVAGKPLVETEFSADEKFSTLPAWRAKGAVTAFLTVQEGCDKFCTFCVVPYTRGSEFSRPVADVVREARALAAQGVREITLLGQNVNAYHGQGPDGQAWSLAQLVRELAAIDGLARLRYTTNHPHDMSDDLMAAHGDVGKLMPYLHLPFQSGCDRILAAMNRKHTIADYRAIVGRVRAIRSDIALSTDIIVGFPGETAADFKETLDAVETIGFAHAFSFKYSPRPGTPAAKREGQVPEQVKSERLVRLQTVLARQQTRFNEGCVGRSLPVLFEKLGRRAGQVAGRSPYLQPVVVAGGDSLIGQIVPVAIRAAGPNCLSGVIEEA